MSRRGTLVGANRGVTAAVILQDAYEVAQRFLDEVIRPEHAPEIAIVTCEATDDGWAFGYNSRAFIEEGNVSLALAGNGPIIVPNSGLPYIGPALPSS